MVVLGISIGTRRNGVAILDGILKEAQVHSFNERWSREKGDVIIGTFQWYIEHYGATHVIVKVPKASHFSLALKQLIGSLDKYCNSRGCLVEYVDIKAIKQLEPYIVNKQTLRQIVVDRYPELTLELNKEIKNKQPYYIKVFEAVIVSDLLQRRKLVQ